MIASVDELMLSRQRLEAAGFRLAVRITPASARIIRVNEPPPDGMVPWTPEEMFNYVGMELRERLVFAGLKMRFDARTEFKEIG